MRLARETSAAGRRRVLALALMNLARALLQLSDLDGALVAAEEAVAVADGFGEPLIRRMTRGYLVDVMSQRRELEKAIALHRQALGVAPVDVLEGLARRATLLMATGKIGRGIRLAGAFEANCERLNYAPGQAPDSLLGALPPSLLVGHRIGPGDGQWPAG